MIISTVRSFLLSYPFPQPQRLPFLGGEYTILKRDAMFIRVESDHGLVGYAPGPGSERAHVIIQDIVRPFLEGRTLADPDVLRIQFMDGPGQDPEAARMYCAVEVGLLDLCAKDKGIPLSQEVGGRVRSRIRLYGSAGVYPTAEDCAAEALAVASRGFRAYKLRPALGPALDLETVHRVRQAVGPDFDLMVDAQTWWRLGERSYTFEMVEQVAREMAAHHIAWLEEPFAPENHEAYLRLKDGDHVPLAAGGHEPSEQACLDLIVQRAVDYVQMDVCCQGGFTIARHLLREIARAGLRFGFECSGTALEVIAAAHLGICWPQTVVEWLEYPFPQSMELLKEPLEIDHGDLIVPRTPGLGAVVDESVVDRYPWIAGPCSYFRTDSPARTLALTADRSGPWEERASR